MENLIEFLESRHSVREYIDRKIEDDDRVTITDLIDEINREHGTHFEAFFDKPEAFTSIIARHTMKGCQNIIVFYHNDPVEAGYYSAKILLKLHEMGFATCYVGASYKKRIFEKDDQTIQCALAFGYGANVGHPHKNKDIDKLIKVEGNKPANFDLVVRAAMSAPTAMNLQRFKIVAKNNEITVELTNKTPFAEFDLGIVRYIVDIAKKN